MTKFKNKDVKLVYSKYPPKMRKNLMALRQLIFDTAKEIKEAGKLEETLKWGEPAYLTSHTKSGSTIRIDKKKSNDSEYAMYFHCQTNLVSTFKKLFPSEFKYEGNRAIVFNENDKIPVKELSFCISMALTYHSSQKTKGKK